eukprot:3636669-Rhodomonas_salina.1
MPKGVTRDHWEVEWRNVAAVTPPTRGDSLCEPAELIRPLDAHMPVGQMTLVQLLQVFGIDHGRKAHHVTVLDPIRKRLDDLMDDRGRVHRQIRVPPVGVVVGRTRSEKIIPLLHLEVVRVKRLDVVEVGPPVPPLVGQPDVHQTTDAQRLPETLETPHDVHTGLRDDGRHPKGLLALFTLECVMDGDDTDDQRHGVAAHKGLLIQRVVTAVCHTIRVRNLGPHEHARHAGRALDGLPLSVSLLHVRLPVLHPHNVLIVWTPLQPRVDSRDNAPVEGRHAIHRADQVSQLLEVLRHVRRVVLSTNRETRPGVSGSKECLVHPGVLHGPPTHADGSHALHVRIQGRTAPVLVLHNRPEMITLVTLRDDILVKKGAEPLPRLPDASADHILVELCKQ